MVENNQMTEVLKEIQKDILNPELIKDNKLHFRVNENIYQVIMPTQKQLSEANDLKNRKYFELLSIKNENGDSVYLMENKLIELLKTSQNIDIEALDKEINDLEQKLIDKYVSTAQLKDSEIKLINKYKQEIKEIKEKRLKLVFMKADYLAPAIQNQASDIYYKYLTSMCTEVYTDNNSWIKMWSSFDEYINDNSNLTYIALGRLTELMLNV